MSVKIEIEGRDGIDAREQLAQLMGQLYIDHNRGAIVANPPAKAAVQVKSRVVEKTAANYPDDGGLKEPERPIEDTTNLHDVVKEHFEGETAATPAAATTEEPAKRKRRTKAEMEAAKAVEDPLELPSFLDRTKPAEVSFAIYYSGGVFKGKYETAERAAEALIEAVGETTDLDELKALHAANEGTVAALPKEAQAEIVEAFKSRVAELTPAAPTEAAATAETPTVEDVREAIRQLAAAKSTQAAVDVLAKFKAPKASDVPEDKRAECIAACKSAAEAA